MFRWAPIARIDLASAPGCCAAVYLSWSTGPRGRVCRPHAAWSAIEIRRVPRLGPDAPVWAPVVCPTRRKPGARQPEQYALDRGIGQIPPTRRPVRMISGVAASGARTAQARTASPYSRVRYVGMTSPTSTYAAWRRLSGRPGGTRLVSAAAMARVPYFASVLPHVVRMEPGLAEVRVPKWFMVYNHLHSVHAIASCNAAEVAMGMLMEATVPRSHRWIPKAYKDRARAGEGHHVATGTG